MTIHTNSHGDVQSFLEPCFEDFGQERTSPRPPPAHKHPRSIEFNCGVDVFDPNRNAKLQNRHEFNWPNDTKEDEQDSSQSIRKQANNILVHPSEERTFVVAGVDDNCSLANADVAACAKFFVRPLDQYLFRCAPSKTWGRMDKAVSPLQCHVTDHRPLGALCFVPY